ncbi:LysR family transcriptional regulator [Mesorhizobium sp. RMAD-H1]|uniref:LysR family transcriptional regulator n=1 Tax=Mesorhizobium sp. RMAD-H1 TaxID=2587065 RepID=UPI00160D2466|nr:LysR family transcriptional regulator [Mesorhizobium sp. RMAD-H1]MBB2969530.1 DNA-binding transcriptional LysR family regulator [Mesorhizobium sp. RMAD-H1]
MFDGRIISGITVFVAVAQTGSYVRAAERVGLTRSGVGKAISRLEHRLGKRLFDRTSRALKLTDEGRTFLDEVLPLIERLHVAAAPSQPEEIRGRLRVSSDSAFGVFLLVPSLPHLIARHPRLKIDLVIRDRVDNLLADGFDVAVRFGEPEHPGLLKQRVLESRIVTCASRVYLSRHEMPASPEALLDGHTCVRLIDDTTGKPHSWNFLRADGTERSIAPNCNVTVNDAPSLLSATRANFGAVRLLDFMIEEELRNGELVEILPEWNFRRWPAYVYAPAQSHYSPSLAAFMDFVLSIPAMRPPKND